MADPSTLERLFHRLLDLGDEDRAALLRDESIAPDLRARVAAMLEADGRPDALFDRPAPHLGAPPLEIGQRIGEYVLIERIGEGGMGEVFRARQEVPIRRDVALKMIKVGMDTRSVIRRFHAERQLLALMDHPHTARVFEAGAGPEGRPYFVMEFVDGPPLTAWADRARTTLAERIELFLQACQAVQHAHQKGVIHRDLKPSNLLVAEVDGKPFLKVIDFGIAKIAEQDSAGAPTFMTVHGHFVGTPEYMSPEQAVGAQDSIDTGTDIYSLGVVLYELLCGRLPFDRDTLRGRGLIEMQRLLREVDPPRPSATLVSGDPHAEQVAGLRRMSVEGLRRGLREELDWIVMRALEKERARRYGSVSELAADLQRFLSGEPVLARAATVRYRLRKTIKRHRVSVAVGALVVLTLLGGVVGTTLFALQASRAERLQAAATQQAVEQTDRAEYATYRASLAAAQMALRDAQPAVAGTYLAQAPVALRGWEWRHLKSRLDRSLGTLEDPEGTRFSTEGRSRIAYTAGGTEVRAVLVDPPRVDGWSSADLSLTFSRHLDDPSIQPTTLRLDATGELLSYVDGAGLLHIEAARDGANRRDLRIFGDDPPWPLIATVGYDPAGRYAVFERLIERTRPGERFESLVVEIATGRVMRLPISSSTWLLPDRGDVLMPLEQPSNRLLRVRFPDGQQLGRLPVLDETKTAVLHHDGAGLYGATWRGELYSWRFDEAAPAWRTPANQVGSQFFVAPLDPNDRLLTGGRNGLVRIWSSEGRLLWTLGGHDTAINDGVANPAGTQFVTRTSSELRLWDPEVADAADVLRGHTNHVYPVAFSPDGASLVSGGWDGSLRLWDVATRRERTEFPVGRGGAVRVVRDADFIEDGTAVLAIDTDGELLRIDVASGRQEILLGGMNTRLAVDPARHRVAVVQFDYREERGYAVLDYGNGRQLAAHSVSYDTAANFSVACAYAPDGSMLAVTLGDRVLRILDGETLEELRTVDIDGFIPALRYSPDGTLLALTLLDGTIRLLDTTTWTVRADLVGHVGRVFALAFHPDGTRLASGGDDGRIRVWDLGTYEELLRLEGHEDYVFSLSFSPDGARLASGSGDSTVRVWDTAPVAAIHEARQFGYGSRRR